ncbi:MAG: helix-turn-helix domain-containing protein [Chloroflexi bacterium]|nr:helix-turn-helix domain-containing protein [Chloroflexota bacterium]
MCPVSTATDLKTIIRLALPIGSRLVTGYPTTPVNWVSPLRARPPFFSEIENSEMILVSTNTLATYANSLSLETVIEKLAQSKASALCVQGLLTSRSHQVAKAHNFPLISLPDRAVLPQVERAVQRLLTDRRVQVEHRAIELQQALQRNATSHRGLTTMLNVLARMLDRPVIVHDRAGNVISRGLPASHGQEWDSHQAMLSGGEFIRRLELEDRLFFEDDLQVIENPAGLTAPLIHQNQLLGYVSALTAGSAPDEFDRMALEFSVPTLIREMVRQQSVELHPETSRPVSRDWITEWLTSPAADDALLALRAGQENFQPGLWYAVALFHWRPTGERANGLFSPDRMVRVAQAELRQRRIQAPLGQYVDRAVLLFPLDEPQQTQRLKQMISLLHRVLAQAAPDGEITVGVGRPAMGLTALRESFHEAERALALPQKLWDESSVAYFGDLSLYELLLGVNDPHLLGSFCERWLATLSRYDEQHHTDLLPTLGAYFDNNGNMARTAHVLNIHRNTLVYRLGRITDILQLDMDDSNVRLNLHLALKIHRMLTGS